MIGDTPAEALIEAVLEVFDDFCDWLPENAVAGVLVVLPIGLIAIAILIFFQRSRFLMTGMEIEEFPD